MSRIIAIIENEPIAVNDAGTEVAWTAKAAIDGDGSGSSHGDPDFQNDTSLHHDGKPLNADVDRYIVVPPVIIQSVVGVVLGCAAEVTYNGKTVTAVVGDIGPRSKIGEMSIATAKALGIPSSPNTGGIEAHVVRYRIFPGFPAIVEGVEYQLQGWKG